MKKIFITTLLLAVTFLSSDETLAQKFPKLDISPMDASAYPNDWKISDKLVKVVYGRPQLKGRSLEKLAPNGKVWRTGANEAAEITFYKDVIFGEKKVQAGTYSLFSIPSKEDWTIILSNQKNVWGSYFYDKSQDVVRVTGKVSDLSYSLDAFSIVFEEDKDIVTMYMGWGNKSIAVSIEQDVPKEE